MPKASGSKAVTPPKNRKNSPNSPDEVEGEAPKVPLKSQATAKILFQLENTAYKHFNPYGFENPLFLCYRNGAISILLNTLPLAKWMLNNWSHVPKENNVDSESLTNLLSALAQQYWSGEHGHQHERKLKELADLVFKHVYGRKAWMFTAGEFDPDRRLENYEQEDSADFLSGLFELVRDELDDSSDPEGTVQAQTFRELFFSFLAASTHCKTCERRKRSPAKDEHEMFQQVYVADSDLKTKSLLSKTDQQCLDFQKIFDASFREKRDQNCGVCREDTNHSIRKAFVKLPAVLLTRVNRVTATYEKHQVPVHFPENLTVPIHPLSKSRYEGYRYVLAAILSHQGETAQSGHYISYVRDRQAIKEPFWIKLDDKVRSHTTLKRINNPRRDVPGVKQLPYILVWELVMPKDNPWSLHWSVMDPQFGKVSGADGSENDLGVPKSNDGSVFKSVVLEKGKKALEETNKTLEKENETLEKENETLKAQTKANNQTIVAVRDDHKRVMDDLKKARKEAREKSSTQQQEIAQLKADVTSLKSSSSVANQGDQLMARRGALKEDEVRKKALNTRDDELKLGEDALKRDRKKLEQDQNKFKIKVDKFAAGELRAAERKKKLDEREGEVAQREKKVEARATSVERQTQTLEQEKARPRKSTTPKPSQPSQLDHDVEKGEDTSTFFAIFTNDDNPAETARALFKLARVPTTKATRISTTVQLSDENGDLRVIKKGTNVNDKFGISFNAKKAVSRKRKATPDTDVRAPRSKKGRKG